jgi:hypothetical protein
MTAAMLLISTKHALAHTRMHQYNAEQNGTTSTVLTMAQCALPARGKGASDIRAVSHTATAKRYACASQDVTNAQSLAEHKRLGQGHRTITRHQATDTECYWPAGCGACILPGTL